MTRTGSRLFSLAGSLAACALVCQFIAACSPGRSKSDAMSFHYANIDQPKRLDPAFIKDLYEGIVSGFIYSGLVQFGKGTEIEPALAGSWELSPDKKTYTFHLRKDGKFADGMPVTSEDVRYSFTRVLRPETESDRKWVLNRIDGAAEVTSGTARELRGLETPDEHTVRITLTKPYPVFLSMLAMTTGAIIPKNAAGEDKPNGVFDKAPVGAGPWLLKQWVQDQRLVFVRNENYWGRKPSFPQLIYHVQVDESARRQQFEIGRHDAYQVGFAAYENWMRDSNKAHMTQAVQELRTDYIGFMCSKPQLSDKRIRQAISHAVDVDTIFRHLQKGRGVRAHGPVPPMIAGYRAEIAPRTYDPQKARDLLQQAGVNALELNLWYRDEAMSGEIAQTVRDNLAKVGVTLTLVPKDHASLRAGIHGGQPDMFLASWTLDYPDMENAMVPPFHSRNIPRQGNQSHFRSEKVDALLGVAEIEADPELRIQNYQAAEDAIIDECPWLFLFHRKTYWAVQPRVKGWVPATMYNADRFNNVDLSASQ